jgi:hypothetical protein
VTSAAAVYTATSYGTSAAINFPIQILAVNPDTFGRTALWGSQESDQPLASLMAQLASAGASATDAIPAVVDDAVWQAMRLKPGAEFSFSVAQNDMTATRFVAVGHVAHIPPVADGSGVQNGSGAGGVLVDLATFNAIYPKGQGDAPTATTHVATPNEVWLRTADDAAALASVRGAIASGALKLSAPSNASGDGPLDRRQAIQDSEADALHVDLLSVLAIAAGTALVLALVGILLGSWLNARNRLTSFALLRALGSEPRQLAGVLLWEQGIVYTLSLGLGVVIGAVLSAAVLPAIIFTTGTARTNVGSQQFIDAIDVPPIQTVVPWSQVGLVLGGLVAISLVSILLMTAQVARPSISQTLRLNED